jgi:hypothetical protein
MIPFSKAELLEEPVTGPTAGLMTELLAGSARKPIQTEELKLKAVADLLSKLVYTPRKYRIDCLLLGNIVSYDQQSAVRVGF